MRKKKIPGKVGQFPTHYVLVCVKRGCNGKLQGASWGEIQGAKCQKCGMLYSSQMLAPNFMKYSYDK